MNEIQKIFAANVRKCRKAAHLSQEKLAEHSGLHRTYIGGIEQKRVNVSLKNVGKIADALNVDPAVLFLSEAPGEAEKTDRGKKISSLFEDMHEVEELPEHNADDEYTCDFALVSWKNNQTSVHPIEVIYEDLTLRILNFLIREGLEGEELVNRYKEMQSKMLALLERDYKL